MSKITNYIKRLWATTESIDCSATKEEMVDGKAFTYKQFRLDRSYSLMASDTMSATITDVGRDGKFEQFTVKEDIGKNITVDTVAIFRSKEAFGMTDCIGAAFGKGK